MPQVLGNQSPLQGLGVGIFLFQQIPEISLSSRPERSGVEGPRVFNGDDRVGREKLGPYCQAKGGTGREGTIQITILNIDLVPDNVK
jgi:hypothetical protein